VRFLPGAEPGEPRDYADRGLVGFHWPEHGVRQFQIDLSAGPVDLAGF
jgi:hypothetical protein